MSQPPPLLRVPVPVLVSWTQHEPGGCGCVCAIYHHGHGGCLRAADPGLLISLAPLDPSPVDGIDPDTPRPVCGHCYLELSALASADPGDPR